MAAGAAVAGHDDEVGAQAFGLVADRPPGQRGFDADALAGQSGGGRGVAHRLQARLRESHLGVEEVLGVDGLG